MSREDLTSGTSDELSAQQVNLAFFVEIEFSSGVINLWSGIGDISWDTKTWTGAGNLLMITPARETTGVTATGLTISLTGVDPAFISLALIEARQNKPVSCWFGFLDSSGVVIVDPYKFFTGLFNYIVINEGEKSAIITVTAENDLIKLQKPRIRRYTDQDQQAEFDGDLGFKHISALQEWNGYWGGGGSVGTDGDSYGGASTFPPNEEEWTPARSKFDDVGDDDGWTPAPGFDVGGDDNEGF